MKKSAAINNYLHSYTIVYLMICYFWCVRILNERAIFIRWTISNAVHYSSIIVNSGIYMCSARLYTCTTELHTCMAELCPCRRLSALVRSQCDLQFWPPPQDVLVRPGGGRLGADLHCADESRLHTDHLHQPDEGNVRRRDRDQ